MPNDTDRHYAMGFLAAANLAQYPDDLAAMKCAAEKMLVCPRCGQKMEHREHAEGCEDNRCPLA